MLNDYENVGKYIGKDNIITLEEELEWIDKKKKEKSTMYTMVDKSTNKFIGTIGINSTTNELGISMSKDFQDKGGDTKLFKLVMAQYEKNRKHFQEMLDKYNNDLKEYKKDFKAFHK